MDGWNYTEAQRLELAKAMFSADPEWHERYRMIGLRPLTTGLWQGVRCQDRETGQYFNVNVYF